MDTQSLKFDGAFVDLSLWPRIFTVDGTPIALIESIVAAIEVKSSLSKSELEDIFKKSSSLRSMSFNDSDDTVVSPLVTAFAYECRNLNLSFFDFATFFGRSPEHSPSLICILNKGPYGLASISAGSAIPMDEPHSSRVPILYRAHKDALLVYLYFLSRWAGMETTVAQVFRRYNDSLFSNMTCFSFDADFLNVVVSDENSLNTARRCFQRRASSDIEDLYTAARGALGLSTQPRQ